MSATTAAAPDKNRRSRITAACAVCRSKRQKCSGEKPVCDQCRLHNEECWWSETKKRGPAKDYLRSLQDRLQETESLLLGVLSRVSDDDLLAVLQHAQSNTSGGGPSHQTWTSSMSGQEHWAQYPLIRLDGIRSWQRHRSADVPAIRSTTQFHRSDTSSTWDTQDQSKLAPMQGELHSPNVLQTPPVDAISVHSAPQTAPSDYYQVHPQAHQRNESWSQPGSTATSHKRRYSEETREAGEALFSISNHLRAASQQYQPQQWQTQPVQQLRPQPTHPESMNTSPTTTTATTTTTTTTPSQFPKHLFW